MENRLFSALAMLSIILVPSFVAAQTHRAVSISGEYFDVCDPDCTPANFRSLGQGSSGGALLSYFKSWPGIDNGTENFQSFHWLLPDTWTQRLDIHHNGTTGDTRVLFTPLVVADGERAAAFIAQMNIDNSQNMFNGGEGNVGNGTGNKSQAYLSLMNRVGFKDIQWRFYPLSVRKYNNQYYVGNQDSGKTTMAISADGHSVVFDSLVTDMAITNAANGGQVGQGLYLAQIPNSNGIILDGSAAELKKIVIPANLIGCTDTSNASNITYGAATVLNTYDPGASDPTRRDLATVAFTAACKYTNDRTRHVLLYKESTGEVTRITPNEDCTGTVTDCDSDMPRFARNGSQLFYATKYQDTSLNDMGLGSTPARGKWRIVATNAEGVPSKVISNLARNTAGAAPEAICPVERKGILNMVVLTQLGIMENSQLVLDRPQLANDYENADIVSVDSASTNVFNQVPLVVSSIATKPRTIANKGSGLRTDTWPVLSDRCQLSDGDGLTLTYTTAATNLVSTDGQDARFVRGQVIQTMLPNCSRSLNRGRIICYAEARQY